MTSRNPKRHTLHLLQSGTLAVLLAGCVVSAPASTPAPDEVSSLINTKSAPLINEGGPVFLLPGTVKMPGYFTGAMNTLSVKAERLDGGAFPRVTEAPVNAEGGFELKGPLTSQLFFATAEFTHENHLHRVRALARAQSTEPLVLDTASSLIAAKVALAAQRMPQDALDYTETTELSAQVRSALSGALQGVDLAQPNEALSARLNAAAVEHPALASRLLRWETSMAPSPEPSPSSTPEPQPSASATAKPELEPVK